MGILIISTFILQIQELFDNIKMKDKVKESLNEWIINTKEVLQQLKVSDLYDVSCLFYSFLHNVLYLLLVVYLTYHTIEIQKIRNMLLAGSLHSKKKTFILIILRKPR